MNRLRSDENSLRKMATELKGAGRIELTITFSRTYKSDVGLEINLKYKDSTGCRDVLFSLS